MKNRVLTYAAIAFATVIVLNWSCKKPEIIETEDPGVSLTTATIKGFLKANLDETDDSNSNGAFMITYDPIVGATVTAIVNTEDWYANPNFNFAYPQKTYTATSDAQGMFTLNPEIGEVQPLSVTIYYSEVNADFTNSSDSTANSELFYPNNSVETYSVVSGQVKIVEQTYFQ